MRQQVIDECGFSSAHINDCRISRRDSFDESKRSLKVRAVPTHRIRRLFRVDLFPVGLSVHQRSPPSDIRCLDDKTRCSSSWSTIHRSLGFRGIVMSFYKERVYPHLVSLLGNPKPIAE